MGIIGSLLGLFTGKKGGGIKFRGGLGDIMQAGVNEVMALEYEELRAFATKLFTSANQRYSRIDKLDLSFTPAIDAVDDGGGKFYIRKFPKVRARDDAGDIQYKINALRAEVFRARQFIDMKTSTVSEAKKYDAHMKEMLGEMTGKEITRDDGVRIWELYRKAEQDNFAMVQAYGSDNVAQMIYQSMADMDDEQILSYVRDVLREAYETPEELMESALADEAGFWI